MNLKSLFFPYQQNWSKCFCALLKSDPKQAESWKFWSKSKIKTRFNQISKAHSEFQNKIKKNSVMGNKVECLQGYKTTCSTITVLSLLQEHISSWSSTPFLNHLRGLWPRMRRKTWKKHSSVCKCLLLSSAPLFFPYTSSFYLKVFFLSSSNTEIIISEEFPYHLLYTFHCSILLVHLDIA